MPQPSGPLGTASQRKGIWRICRLTSRSSCASWSAHSGKRLLAAQRDGVFVQGTAGGGPVLLGERRRWVLYEDALALVAFAGPASAQDHR